jgi:hypothetical protein
MVSAAPINIRSGGTKVAAWGADTDRVNGLGAPHGGLSSVLRCAERLLARAAEGAAQAVVAGALLMKVAPIAGHEPAARAIGRPGPGAALTDLPAVADAVLEATLAVRAPCVNDGAETRWLADPVADVGLVRRTAALVRTTDAPDDRGAVAILAAFHVEALAEAQAAAIGTDAHPALATRPTNAVLGSAAVPGGEARAAAAALCPGAAVAVRAALRLRNAPPSAELLAPGAALPFRWLLLARGLGCRVRAPQRSAAQGDKGKTAQQAGESADRHGASVGPVSFNRPTPASACVGIARRRLHQRSAPGANGTNRRK